MPQKIDSKMLQIHQACTQGASERGKKISEQEALQLIKRADEINSSPTSSFSSETRRGNKYLIRLLEQHQTDFSQESTDIINKYIRTGRVPSDGGIHHGGGSHGGGGVHHGGGSHGSGGVHHGGGSHGGGGVHHGGGSHGGGGVHHGGGSHGGGGVHHGGGSHGGGGGVHHGGGSHGGGGIPIGGGVNGGGAGPVRPSDPNVVPPSGGGGAPGNGGSTGPVRPSDSNVVPPSGGGSSGGVTPPTTPPNVGGGNVGTTGPNGTLIVEFKAAKATWGCHWFPMQETREGGDPTNNLYAVGGPLDKLDQVTGGKSREYEFNNNRKAIDDGAEFGWWGHCNNASEAACILPEPKHAVVMTGRDGSQVRFSRNDIQGLLVKVTPCLVDRVDFKGERYNGGRDNPNDPAPSVFLEVMKQWSAEGIPFVLDIDRNEQVWNFPYDQVKIYESDKAPEGFSGANEAGTKYYHIEMSGTGFPEKSRVYECWVKSDGSSDWIKTPNTHNNPDFMWRPHPVGDVMDKSSWQVRGRPSNPQVDPQMVYEIYVKSLE